MSFASPPCLRPLTAKRRKCIQRYLAHFPAAGEIVIFDRSWYNRAGAERVMGFCADEQHRAFLHLVPFAERTIVESGIILVKYWLEVSKEARRSRPAASRRGREIRCASGS